VALGRERRNVGALVRHRKELPRGNYRTRILSPVGSILGKGLRFARLQFRSRYGKFDRIPRPSRRSSKAKPTRDCRFPWWTTFAGISAPFLQWAVTEKVIASNPRSHTSKHAPKGTTRAMSVDEVNTALGAVELREQLLLHIGIFSGFRLGEMLGLQRRHVAEDATVVKVEQRVYRGDIDNLRTNPYRREVAVPPRTAELLLKWMSSAVGLEPEAYVFAGEKGKPLWRILCCTITSSEAQASWIGMGGLSGGASNRR
jgi:integrase